MSIDTMNITTHLVDEGLNGKTVRVYYSFDSVMLEGLGAGSGLVDLNVPGKSLGVLDLAGGVLRLETGPYGFVDITFSGFDGLARLLFRAGSGAAGDAGTFLSLNAAGLGVEMSGAIQGAIAVSLVGGSFAGSTGAALPGVSFTDLPAGLTGVATKTGESTASLSFGGVAAEIGPGQSASVGVNFGAAAFAGGSAGAVTGATRLIVLKNDAAILTYSASTLNIVDDAALSYSASTLSIID